MYHTLHILNKFILFNNIKHIFYEFYRGTQVEVKNKKGNSPLWLAANGGHLNVVDLLYHAGADIDSQDNRKVCDNAQIQLIPLICIAFIIRIYVYY